MPTEVTLGGFRFSADTASLGQMERAASYRWPGQERIGREPALQYLGPGLETISLSGTIYPQYRGGTRQVAALRAEARSGKPLLMTDGTGRVRGRWAVRSVRETRTALDESGRPRRIDFDLELAYHGPASASASPGTPETAPPLGGGVGVEGSEARAAFQRIELMPADVRSELQERVELADRAGEVSRRKGVPMRDALAEVAGDRAGEIAERMDAAGLEAIPRRLWGPAELAALLPGTQGIEGLAALLPGTQGIEGLA